MGKLQNVRNYRIGAIMKLMSEIKAGGRVANRSRLIAECAVEFGCSRRVVLDYIDTLILAGKLSMEDFEDTSRFSKAGGRICD